MGCEGKGDAGSGCNAGIIWEDVSCDINVIGRRMVILINVILLTYVKIN
jgi:hypothetical protein